ncbi:hypothetical protein ON010_g17502 [Phytophthora cinnamomi]|nr:hypothetical protein ON010_g17502 [Phytophthora cinnamomi]
MRPTKHCCGLDLELWVLVAREVDRGSAVRESGAGPGCLDRHLSFVLGANAAANSAVVAADDATHGVAAVRLAVAVGECTLVTVDGQALAVASMTDAEPVVLHHLVATFNPAAFASTCKDQEEVNQLRCQIYRHHRQAGRTRTVGNASSAALCALLAALVAALLAAAVNPAETAGLRALGAGRCLAALATAVGDAEPATHDAGGAALHRALLATAMRDAQAAALGRLLALREAAAPRVRPCRRRCDVLAPLAVEDWCCCGDRAPTARPHRADWKCGTLRARAAGEGYLYIPWHSRSVSAAMLDTGGGGCDSDWIRLRLTGKALGIDEKDLESPGASVRLECGEMTKVEK